MSDNIITKASNTEVDFIQTEIETYTKKIEHEKINARLAKERYEKQISMYMQLQGMPVPFKSKEQKEREKKERKEQKKQRKPLYEAKPAVSKLEILKSNPNLLEKGINKNEVGLDKLTNEINGLLLENKELKKQIEDLRKEKLGASSLLDTIKVQNETLKHKISDLVESNKEALSRIKFSELEKTKEEMIEGKKDFGAGRDHLEEKYHHIIEENIRREREHKKELFKKRNKLGSIAASVLPNNSNPEEDEKNNAGAYSVLSEEQQERLLEEEDISDRTPILDVLIDKWKFYNKYKKGMLERYIKNASSIRDAFDKMMKYLGIDDFTELPIVLEKMEDQMSSIEIYISQLTNNIDLLADKKKMIEFRIQSLKFRIENTSNEKLNFQENKQGNINRLKAHIGELKDDIDRKRQFFIKLQPETDNFLSYLDETYISEFIPKKVPIIKDLTYNESNIIELIANVEDYNKLIEEFDKSAQGHHYDKKLDLLVNKDIDKLKQEMRAKLELFKKDNYIGNEFYTTVKGDVKVNTSFDETIRKMADNIVRTVNQGVINVSPVKKKK
jgi:hypothetical protein